MSCDNITVEIQQDTYDFDIVQSNVELDILGLVNYNLVEFVWVDPPATRNSPGQKGQMAMDDDYIYVCYALNSWGRMIITKGW